MFVVVMEGTSGNLYRTGCQTMDEAERLRRHHVNLGWNAWIEVID